MYALIERGNKGMFYLAHIVENGRGVYRWRFEQDHSIEIAEPFANLDDAVSVLRESRLEWENPELRIAVVDDRKVRLSLDDIDYKPEDPTETIVEDSPHD